MHLDRCLGNAEIGQLDVAVVGDQDVGRRHVAVDDFQGVAVAVLGLVGVVQGLQYLDGQEQRYLLGEPLVLFAQTALDLAQVLAQHVLHGDEIVVVLAPQVVDLDDVGMGEFGRDLGFVDQHLDVLVVFAVAGKDLLDGDDLFEALDPFSLGLVDLGHAAAGDQAEQDVIPQFVGIVGRRAFFSGLASLTGLASTAGLTSTTGSGSLVRLRSLPPPVR